MCGICGIINFNNEQVQEAPVRKMMKLQKHRGPDDEGVFLEDNIGLGFVRLSILDLSPAGHQPMVSSDDRFVVVFNGEIFNYIELREDLTAFGYSFRTGTDTEVLLTAYTHWGEDCLHMFNGMWAFVIYDRINKTVFGARDRYGIKPFYYYVTKEIFAFASEIPPLLTLLPDKPTPDRQSIFDFLVFNRTDQTDRTFFNEVKKLQHGQKISFQNTSSKTFSIMKWYDLRERVFNTEGFKNPEEFRHLFSSAVGLRLRSDVPVGVCLSGGLDSSGIVSILLKDYGKHNLNTFSAVYKKGQTGDETEFISEYKALLENMYYTSPDAGSLFSDINMFVKAHGEPIPSTSPYAQFKVMELARKKVVVTLDGQGADELLAGYHYFFGYLFKDLLRKGNFLKLVTEIYYYLKLHKSTYGLQTFAFLMLPEYLRTRLRVNEKQYIKKDIIKQLSGTNAISGNLYGSGTLQKALIDHFEYKLEHLLKWEDRNSMWFSLEARVPFLDHRLVEKTLASETSDVIERGMTKSIFRESMKDIVPEKIRLRKDKVGFGTPEDEWFRAPEFTELVEEVLAPGSFITTHFIDRGKALRLYKSHLKGGRNISKEIWKWIHLELWHRQFFT